MTNTSNHDAKKICYGVNYGGAVSQELSDSAFISALTKLGMPIPEYLIDKVDNNEHN